MPRIPAALSGTKFLGVGFTHAQRRRLTVGLPAVLTTNSAGTRMASVAELGHRAGLEQHATVLYCVLTIICPELMPVVYTQAIQRPDEYRGQRGLFLSIDDPTKSRKPSPCWGCSRGRVD